MIGSFVIQTARPAPGRTDPEQWVHTYANQLFRHALARVGQRQLAEDLVQETFLAAWTARARFAGRSSERTWLLRILRNKIADHYRRESHRLEFADLEALAEFEAAQFRSGLPAGGHWSRNSVPASWPDAGQSLEDAEFWETVHQCVGKLPEKVARVFLLRQVEGCESAAICEMLNIKRAHLFVMLHRARLALRRCLERNWFATPSRDNPPPNRS
jgi:RNA polymerase sigma-70 factor (TIGR02943 family)